MLICWLIVCECAHGRVRERVLMMFATIICFSSLSSFLRSNQIPSTFTHFSLTPPSLSFPLHPSFSPFCLLSSLLHFEQSSELSCTAPALARIILSPVPTVSPFFPSQVFSLFIFPQLTMTTAMFKTGMNRSLLNKDFFQTILDRAYGSNTTLTKSWSEEELDSSSSILSNISSGADDEDDDDDFSFEENTHNGGTLSTASTSNSNSGHSEEPCPMNDMTGHFLYRIEFEARTHPSIIFSSPLSQKPLSISTTSRIEGHYHASSTSHNNSNDGQLYVVIKSKPIDTALIELTNIMAQLQGGDLAEEYDLVKDQTGFRNSHIREIELAELSWHVGGAMENISTKVYNVLRNDSQQLYALCLEYLDPSLGNITHMNSTDAALSTWSSNDIHLVLRDLAAFHAQFLCQEDRILGMTFLETPTRSLMKLLRPAYEAMVKTNQKNEPGLFSQFLTDSMLDFLKHSDEYWAKVEKSPRTLVSYTPSPFFAAFM